MDNGASSEGVPVTSASGKDTGPSSVITELLTSWDDSQLLQLTEFYWDRLQQAMEGGVHGVSLALMANNQFSVMEHQKISDLADKGERADSSKLLLSLVMEKGSRAPRVMWETFVKMWNDVPELDKILKEIQEHGCDSSHQPIPAQHLLKILSELKDLRVITELLAICDDFQLLQLTDFYRDRLEQAMEGGVHGVSLALTAENQFSGEEHRKISDLADKGERADSSKLLLSLVMEKGSRARRVMWETFVKMLIGVPNFDKILKEIQIYGPGSVITELLASWDDSQLLQLTEFYRDRLEQAMEGGVHGVSLALTAENQFSGEEHREISDLADKGERADSSKLLLSLVMEKGSRARRVMWETFVKMRIVVPNLDKILKEIQIYGCDSSHRPISAQILLKILSELKDIQQKHKETLRAQTEKMRVNTILMREKVKVFQLVDRYAELTVISTVRDRRLVEHELLARGRDHEERREQQFCRELEKIRTDQLFQSSSSRSKSKSGSSAAMAGVPGIGKTTMVQKIVYDWATGKIYQQFQFVFSFKFRDLNSINHKINLKELILDQYPYFGNILREVWKNPEGLLFIFDGLDEFNDTIDFADSQRDTEPRSTCTDRKFKCKVSDIVYSLIQGKLLPGCSVLVTTRPHCVTFIGKG
ncbi:uncharacterized protein [Hemitrygon akajei]|uniref:uncharacterized protein n=1 Tax=Hemitrygon akajei TaxID=2704970 RepID=UPI003BF96CE0